jgi:hypothetical protein
MNVPALLRWGGLFLCLGLAAGSTRSPAQNASDGKRAVLADRAIAGGPEDFMEVRHLVLRGTNEEIGRALAAIARERFRVKPEPSPDPFRTRVQRRYLRKNYPILLDRMAGVASAFGKRVDEDAWDFSGLPYLVGPPGGCSVVYYPPGVTADGHGVVSRNYEYSTGTLFNTWPRRGELAASARPYLIELHPERGYASLALCAYDLLSGVLDGINSEGLTVTMLADDEMESKYPLDPAYEGGVGLGVMQVLRMLLDTCATVEEAKEALLLTKQYYEFIPVHYLIADRRGKAFVWEYSQAHNREYVVANPDKPLISTNFRLHAFLEGKDPPSARRARGVCDRYCALAERVAAAPGKQTVEFIKESHQAVNSTLPGTKRVPPNRTLWHALYYPEQQKVEVSFYLRDEPDPERPGKSRIVRSGYAKFVLSRE